MVKTGIDKKHLAQLINKDDPIILDVGCNDGRESLEFLDYLKPPRSSLLIRALALALFLRSARIPTKV